jgi:hypothetical protein
MPGIFTYINKISGYTAIVFDPNILIQNSKFFIKDNDLKKQQTIKQIRITGREKRETTSEENIASNI